MIVRYPTYVYILDQQAAVRVDVIVMSPPSKPQYLECFKTVPHMQQHQRLSLHDWYTI